MARKTSKAARQAIERYEGMSAWYVQVIRLFKSNPEALQGFIREKGESFYHGMLAGARAMCSEMLHEQGCYHGFSYRSMVTDKLVTIDQLTAEHINDDYVYFGVKL